MGGRSDLPNRYRRVLIGLSNDQLDNDGEPLAPGEKNYLELYGAFPSLSVLRARFDLEGVECVFRHLPPEILIAPEGGHTLVGLLEVRVLG